MNTIPPAMDTSRLHLRQVIGLGQSINIQTPTRAEIESLILEQQPPKPEPKSEPKGNRPPHIGDFTRVWDFLGKSASGAYTSTLPPVLGSLAAETRLGTSTRDQVRIPYPRKSHTVSTEHRTPEPTAQPPRTTIHWTPIPQAPIQRTPIPHREILSQDLPSPFVSSKAKDEALISFLLSECPQDRATILQPQPAAGVNTGSMSNMSFGVHVFLDLSNITIGFLECLKRCREIPRETKMPMPPLSFRRLAQIMERGRSVAKRVLVGSRRANDTVAAPEVQDAYNMGWDVNILDRVMRAKPTTNGRHRLRGFAARYESENPANWCLRDYATATMSEQGVDEILHLKMMESLVDSTTPQIMVLGTGDAAVAEFSGGFMKMVERALVRGWRVELICFSENLGSAYLDHAFRNKWGYQFIIFDLTVLVEILLDN